MGRADAAGQVASAGIYAGGRTIDNALAWVKSIAVLLAQVAGMKQMMNLQKNQYDDISNRQIQYLMDAVDVYVTDLETLFIPAMKKAYPDIPQAAEFKPVNVGLFTRDTYDQNGNNMEAGASMIERLNNFHRLNNRSRLYFESPLALECIQLEGIQIKALLQGKVTNDDLMEVFTDVNDNAFATGHIGNTGRQTAAALGVTRLRMQAAGREALHAHLAALNAHVNPIQSEARLEDYLMKPANMLGFALQQQELIQQSTQNLFNTLAQKEPYLMAQLQARMTGANAKLQLMANRGNLVNQYVPNFAGIFGPAFQGFMASLSGTGKVDSTAGFSHPNPSAHAAGGAAGNPLSI